MLAVFVILIFSLSFGVLIAGTNAARSIKSANKQNELDIKKANEWNPHLEIPGWKWYDDLRQRLDQITTEAELNRFNPSLYGHRKDFMGYNYEKKDNPFRGSVLPREYDDGVQELVSQLPYTIRTGSYKAGQSKPTSDHMDYAITRADWESVKVPHPFNKASGDMQRYYQKGFNINHTRAYNDKLMCWENIFTAKLPNGDVMFESFRES